MTETNKQCLACSRGPDQIPLIALDYLGSSLWICPQHLPVLIHNPAQLVGKLAGADKMQPAEDKD